MWIVDFEMAATDIFNEGLLTAPIIRKSGTRICCDAQRKSYAVFLPQHQMERIAIERVPAAWKSSLENRPYEGEAQVVSSVGRLLPKFMRHPRSATSKTMWGFGSSVGRAPITTKQFVEDLKAAS